MGPVALTRLRRRRIRQLQQYTGSQHGTLLATMGNYLWNDILLLYFYIKQSMEIWFIKCDNYFSYFYQLVFCARKLELIIRVNNSQYWSRVLLYMAARLTTLSLDLQYHIKYQIMYCVCNVLSSGTARLSVMVVHNIIPCIHFRLAKYCLMYGVI